MVLLLDNIKYTFSRQWQLTSMSDRGSVAGMLLQSIAEVGRWQQQLNTAAPTVVHCGGGVGRTALYIALNNCLDQVGTVIL